MVGLKELDQFDYGVQYQRGQPSTTQVSGIAGLASPASLNIAGSTQNALADMRSLGEMPTIQPPPPPPPSTSAQANKPVLAISRSTGKIWANGKLFTTDDAQGALESEQFVGGAPVPAPAAEATDWEPLSEEAYAQHLGKIKNPSLTTLAAKNFGTGVDTSQMLAGYGLQFLGATETGQGIVRQQLEDIRKNAPYQRSLEDIPERGAVEWLVANVAQQGPNLIESLVTAATGAAVGAAAGGGPNPFTAVGGAISAMVGKQAFKQAVMAAVKKQIKGEVLDAAEEKLLREATGMTLAATKTLADDAANAYGGRAALTNIINASRGARNQAMAGGAAIATGLQNYATGVADLFGESVEGGQPDRFMAALGAVPYAAAESIPEYLAALRLFKGIGKKVVQAGSRTGRVGTAATNIGLGIGAGAALEGSTETFQETLGIGMNPDIEIDSPEGVSRLLNAFAAGAAIGGMVGGASSLNTGKATDILSGGTKPAEQKGTTITQPEAPQPGGAYLGPLYTPPAPPAAPTPAAPQGELFPGAPMGQAPVQVPTGPMQPSPAAPGGQMELPLAPGPTGPALDMIPGGSALRQAAAGGLPQAVPMPPLSQLGSALAQTAQMQGPAMPMPGAPTPVQPTQPSALSQVAAGGLPQAAPQGQFANRLLQQQAVAAEQARQAQLQATSGSALARIGRGEAVGMAPPGMEPIPTDPREARVMYERMVKEQAKRDDLLSNKVKLTRYAKQREVSAADMRKLLLDNSTAARPLIARLKTALASPEYQARETANKAAARTIKFKEVTPDAAQAGQVEQGGQQQYPQDRTRVGGRRVNRNVPPQVQEAGRPAGGRNRLVKGAPPAQVQEAAAVSTAPVHDKFIADFDDARLNDANKVKLRALVKRAQAAGVLTDKDVKELDIAFKDRDQTADDIAPLASSMIENNKPKAVTQQAAAPEPAPTPAKERQRAPKFNLKPEAPPPKAEGAAAAPAQKAEKVSADILRDAGWDRREISDYEYGGKNAARAEQAARGYIWISGEYRAVTKKDIENAKAATEEYKTEKLPKLLETIRNKFAEARKTYRDFGPNDKLANVPYSDSPAVTEAEAIRNAENDFVIRMIPKLERAYARTDEAKAEPSTALTVVPENQHFIEPELEAKIKREQADIAETERLATQGDKGEVDDLIVALNTLDPADVDYRDALSALLGFAKDSSVNKDVRKKAQDYLENEVEPEAVKLAERSVMEPVSQAELDRSTIVTAMEQFNNGEITLTQRIVGVLVSAWKRIKGLDLTYGDRPLADFIKGGPQFFNIEKGKVVPKGQGRYSTTMWDVADTPMNVGQIRLKIGKFVSGFASKPKVYVFRNQADLKASDPKLYARAAAGRPGDFDTVLAAGYSLGNEIIVFSDRIGGDQHLAFVLAHETLGHFGLRGLMGGADFDRVMTGLYDTDSRLRAGVDARMAAFGTPKAEAVEEYLSDYAAQLHTSLVRRVWKGIKGALNRVGIQFGDEATRYLLSQAKRYVKTGETTGSFVTSSVAHRLWGVETGQVGRFSVKDMADTQTAFADTIMHTMPDLPKTREDFKNVLTNFNEYWDKFKEEAFSLTNFQALRNPGAYAFKELMAKTVDDERYIFTKYNARIESIVYKSEDHKNRVSQMMIDGRIVSVFRKLGEALSPAERDLNLFRIGTFADKERRGEVIADDDAIKNATDAGTVTAADVKRIKEKYQKIADKNEPMFKLDNGNLVPRQDVIDRYINRGILTFDEMKNGVDYTREFRTGEDKTAVEKQRFKGFKDLTQEQYDDYVLARKAIADVELELLRAKYEGMLANKRISDASISRLLKRNKLTGDAAKLVDKTMQRYATIYTASYNIDDRGNLVAVSQNFKDADDFLVAVNRALISSDAKNDDDVRKFLEQKDADDFMTSLADFRSKRTMPDGDLKYLFQNEVKMVVLSDINLQTEEERAKRTMTGGYVPIIRNKAYQMLLQAYDAMGRKVKLHEDHRKLLVYSQFDTVANAKSVAETYNKGMGDKTYEVLVQQDDGSYKLEAVRFKATYGEALQTTSTDPALNLEEFLHGVRLFGINLTPNEMQTVITAMTTSGDTLRNKLEFSATPGVDKNSGIFAMARYIQLRAGVIAKTKTRSLMRELMDRTNPESQKLWDGNREQVFSLYNRVQSETNPDLKAHYTQELAHALHMFTETNPDAKGWDGSQAGYDKIKDKLDRSNMNRFYNASQRSLELLDNNASAQETDFGNNRFVAGLRAFTSIAFLGMSMAQSVMNFAAPYTNWMPYMASLNARNGFGGGFSIGKVAAEYNRALMQVGVKGLSPLKGGRDFNTAEFYEDVANDKAKRDALGLTVEEARFLSLEIREGKLQPAQTNALLGVARNGITNRYYLRALDIWMAPFNLPEQASRRAAGLAAFRLSMARISADTKLTAEQKFEIARGFAVNSLDLTLGEYSMMNRPPMWRGGLPGLLYMYKVYPTTVIQLFARLSRPAQLSMLGMMWALTGVAGLPFAEDFEDLIDTIAQMLGFQMPSVRAEAAKIMDDLFPGLAPVVLKGVVNTMLGSPADLASRFSLGDFVPGSGILLAGSKVEEEVKDILGPMPAFLLGAITTARDLAFVPFSETKDLQSVLRASPITAGRMVGDAWAYMGNGAIVDRRGYVVSPDMTIGTVITRLLGFYPAAAANEYEAIRIAKRIGNYQKEVVAAYRLAWIKGDPATRRSIERAVDEWNRGAKGTGLEISNFRKNSERALKDSKLSATQRTLKSTGTAGREDITRITDLLLGE